MKKILTLILVSVMLCGVPLFSALAKAAPATDVTITVEKIFGVMPDSYIGSFGLYGPNTVENDYRVGYYYPMCGMSVLPDGNLLIADTAYGRIHLMDTDFAHMRTFGSLGMGDDMFQYPVDIALDADGNIYVADLYNCAVSKYSSSYQFVGRFGSEGAENGQFMGPGGIAVDRDGYIYVSDAQTARIQKFDSSFKFVSVLNLGSTSASFDSPGPIRVGPNGNIFVAEMKDGKIYEFKANGDFVRSVLKVDDKNPLQKLGAFEFDKDGNIYCLDRAPEVSNIRVFNFDGKETAKYTVADPNNQCDGLAAGGGNIYVHVYGRTAPGSGQDIANPFIAPSVQKLFKLDMGGRSLANKEYDPVEDGRGGNIVSCAATSSGDVYAVNQSRIGSDNKSLSEIFIWDSEGKFLNSLTAGDLGIDTTMQMTSVTVDSFDNVYIGATAGGRDPEGLVVKIPSGEETLSSPIVINSTMPGGDKIGEDELQWPSGLAVDRMDNLYATDLSRQSVVIYTNKGRRRDELSVSAQPSAVAVDPLRNVACTTDASVVIVDKKGRDVGSFGGQGRKPGQVYYPRGVLFSNTGAVIISDCENGRIQIFERKEGSDFEVTYTSPRMFYVCQGMSWGRDGKVYLADSFHNVVYKLAISGQGPAVGGEAGGPEPPLPPAPPAPQVIPSDGEISFSPSDIKVQNGGSIDVTINVKYASNIYGVGMTLKYDPSFLSLDKCEAGDFLSSDGNKNLFIYKDEPKGTAKIGGPTRTGNVSGMNGQGTLIKLRLTGLKEGDAKLELSDVLVKDPDLNNISITAMSAKVKVAPKDSTPPLVTMTVPNCVWNASLTATGTTEKDAKLQLKQGTSTTDVKLNPDGSFSIKLTLAKGENKFSIVATDPAGNSKEYLFSTTLASRNIVIMWIGKTVYMVNGENRTLKVAPQIIGGSTYIPMRSLGEALNCKVDWDGKEKKATYTYSDPCSGAKIVLEAWIDKTVGKLNGQPLDFGKAPKIIGGSTLVPLRAISTGLGADVAYEAATKQITITHPKP